LENYKARVNEDVELQQFDTKENSAPVFIGYNDFHG